VALKASVYIATSLDGFIARENGELDWLSAGENDGSREDYGFHVFLNSVDTLVMGRKTFELVQSSGMWPYGTKRVIVLSSKPVEIPSDLDKTVEAQSCSPIELVKLLSERGVKHLYVDGGQTIQSFLNAGLIQQIIITRIPVLIGEGIRLFGALNKDVKQQHIETNSFENGFVQSKYEVI
jgi:dihydrofolate reductase